MLAAEAAIPAHLQTLGRLLLVLGRAVVPALAVRTRQVDDVAHIAVFLSRRKKEGDRRKKR
jgi:hypothetical protein